MAVGGVGSMVGLHGVMLARCTVEGFMVVTMGDGTHHASVTSGISRWLLTKQGNTFSHFSHGFSFRFGDEVGSVSSFPCPSPLWNSVIIPPHTGALRNCVLGLQCLPQKDTLPLIYCIFNDHFEPKYSQFGYLVHNYVGIHQVVIHTK